MTDPDFERRLGDWLVDSAAPSRPDYAGDIAREARRRRQRARWTFLGGWLAPEARAGSLASAGRRRSALLLLALLVATAAAVAVSIGRPAPRPVESVTNGLLAFSEDGDIVSVDPLTGTRRVLVGGSTIDENPVWAPRGDRIAFARASGGGAVPMVATSSGGQVRELSSSPVEAVFGLTWSDDGSWLAYSNGDLWIVPSDGSGATRLDLGLRAEFPRWRPGSEELVFSNASGRGLFLVRRDGSSIRPLTFGDGTIVGDSYADWVSDGRLVAFRDEGGAGEARYRMHVLTIGPDGRIVDDRAIGPSVARITGYPAARDGRRAFALAPVDGGTGWRLVLVALDGSDHAVNVGPTFASTSVAVAWSPDSTMLVVNDLVRLETWIIDARTGESRRAPWTDPTDEPPKWQAIIR